MPLYDERRFCSLAAWLRPHDLAWVQLARLGHRVSRARRVVTRSPLDELGPGEALALTWADVDLVDLKLTISGQLTRARRGEPARVVARKGAAPEHAAVIFPVLEAALTEHLQRELAAGRGHEADFVQATLTRRPLHQRNVAAAIEKAAEAAGLGKVTPHDLRRSFASLAARRGVYPVQASRMTGHSLGAWTRQDAGDYGKAQREEARTRMLGAGFGVAREPVR